MEWRRTISDSWKERQTLEGSSSDWLVKREDASKEWRARRKGYPEVDSWKEERSKSEPLTFWSGWSGFWEEDVEEAEEDDVEDVEEAGAVGLEGVVD